MIAFRKLAILVTAALVLLFIVSSLFGKYGFGDNYGIWSVIPLAAALVACFHYLRDFRFNLVLVMSFFVWMGLILRLAVIQLKGNIDAFVQFGDLTPSEYSRATIYISLACGMSLLGIILAGKSIRPNSAAKLTYDSRIAFNLLLILAFVQVTQLLYLYYLTPVLNLISTYRPGDILEKVLAYFRSEFF